jgi:hypothetical protein
MSDNYQINAGILGGAALVLAVLVFVVLLIIKRIKRGKK